MCLGFALGLVAGRVVAAEAHRVQPKATVDDPRFSIHCQVLRDGAFLAYYVRPGLGPTLVLVPETNGDRSQYYEPRFMDALDPGFAVVVVELRGQGRSWPPPVPGMASIEQYASDVMEVVQALHPPRWYVSGHSLGGMISIEIAGRRPPGLCGIISLEGWAHHRVQKLAFPEMKERTGEEKAEARRQRVERYRSQRWTDEERDFALGKVWITWERGEKILRETDYPLLSVWGDRGMPQRPGRDKLLLPDKPNIEVAWITGSDHYITDPAYAPGVVALLNAFVSRVEKRGVSAPVPGW